MMNIGFKIICYKDIRKHLDFLVTKETVFGEISQNAMF